MNWTTSGKIKTTNDEIDYIVKITNNKNAYLKVNSKRQIVLSAPKRMSARRINNFVDDNIDKMIKAANKMLLSAPYSLTENWIYHLGQKYNFKYTTGRGYKFIDNVFIIKGITKEVALKNFLKKEAQVIIERAHQLAKFEIIDCEFSVRDMISKWGVCYPSRAKINLSTRLIHHDWDVIDYVIIHELCHMYQANHSKLFWGEVEKRCPNYKQIKKRLKRW